MSNDFWTKMLRGRPKLADLKRLESGAQEWAHFFYTLRDGQPGFLLKTQWRRIDLAGIKTRPPDMENLRDAWSGRLIFAKIIPVETKTQTLREFSRKYRALGDSLSKAKAGVLIIFPARPSPELWERLKRARTVREVHRLAREVQRWQRHFVPRRPWPENPGHALQVHAEGFLQAKRLPNYAKTNRPRSDDKRVEFLAKAMAGLTQGIAPITAAKRLSRRRWPKELFERPLKEFTKATKGAQQ